ncbi:hypothetical protein GCM10027089_19650 [Nocardia thraciensis]
MGYSQIQPLPKRALELFSSKVERYLLNPAAPDVVPNPVFAPGETGLRAGRARRTPFTRNDSSADAATPEPHPFGPLAGPPRDYDGGRRDSPDDEELGRCWQDDCTWDRTADYSWTRFRCPSPVRSTY